jgi:hypothetical protein
MLDEEIWDFKNKSKEELSWGDLQDHSERLNELQELYLAAIERRDKHQWESVSEASKRKERYMEEYAKASCLSLCENMCIALPRELRDMVYEYLIGDTTVFVDRAARHASRSPIVSWPFSSMPYTYSKISHGRLCTTTSSFQDSPLHPTSSIVHCWNYEFVGHDMLKEMPHTWYRTTTFIFLDPSVFRSFFECDLWKCGLDPRELVQSVNVSWSKSALLRLLTHSTSNNTFLKLPS